MVKVSKAGRMRYGEVFARRGQMQRICKAVSQQGLFGTCHHGERRGGEPSRRRSRLQRGGYGLREWICEEQLLRQNLRPNQPQLVHLGKGA